MIEVKTVLTPFADAVEGVVDGQKYVTSSRVLSMVCLLREEIEKLNNHSNPNIRDAAKSMMENFDER